MVTFCVCESSNWQIAELTSSAVIRLLLKFNISLSFVGEQMISFKLRALLSFMKTEIISIFAWLSINATLLEIPILSTKYDFTTSQLSNISLITSENKNIVAPPNRTSQGISFERKHVMRSYISYRATLNS